MTICEKLAGSFSSLRPDRDYTLTQIREHIHEVRFVKSPEDKTIPVPIRFKSILGDYRRMADIRFEFINTAAFIKIKSEYDCDPTDLLKFIFTVLFVLLGELSENIVTQFEGASKYDPGVDTHGIFVILQDPILFNS